jgi:DNA-binding transcriptional regulator LsrR (DeoR family)
MSEITSFSTMILHDKRNSLGLSCNEYCVADLIDHYSEADGWCDLSRQDIADMMGISKQSIIKILSSLLKQELVNINANKKLSSSERWKKYF